MKLLDKIAEQCPAEVWQTGCIVHFLNFIDFFDTSVQAIIMNLVKKGLGEFYSMKQWNQEVKDCLKVIVAKCTVLTMQDDTMLIKCLECLSILLSRLNECQDQDMNSSEDEKDGNDESSNEDRIRFVSDARKITAAQNRIITTVNEIYEETFDDQACISNFMNMLNGRFAYTNSLGDTPSSESSTSQKKAQMLLFKILNL